METARSHRVAATHAQSFTAGTVRFDPVKFAWLATMCCGTVAGFVYASWGASLLFVTSTLLVLLLGHSLGNHRRLVHRSFGCPRWLEVVLVYLGVQVGIAGPLGLLRQHEIRDFAQRMPRCHPYLRHGSSFLRDAWWQLCCRLELDHAPQVRIETSIRNDPILRFLERTWMAQQLPVAALLFWWGGWAFVFWGVCARLVACMVGHWLIGYFAHNAGPRDYHIAGAAVQGHNLPWAALITMGEAWHNNHHAYPGSARLGLNEGQWDPGWWVLVGLERVGLVSYLVVPQDLPDRPELKLLRHQERIDALVGPAT